MLVSRGSPRYRQRRVRSFGFWLLPSEEVAKEMAANFTYKEMLQLSTREFKVAVGNLMGSSLPDPQPPRSPTKTKKKRK